MDKEFWKNIAKLSGGLLAVTLAVLTVIWILPRLIHEILVSTIKGREVFVGAIVLLMGAIVLVWALAVRTFARSETQPRPPKPVESTGDSKREEEEVKRMSKL